MLQSVAANNTLQAGLSIGFSYARANIQTGVGTFARACAGRNVDVRGAAQYVFKVQPSRDGFQGISTDIVPPSVANHIVKSAYTWRIAAVGTARVCVHKYWGQCFPL